MDGATIRTLRLRARLADAHAFGPEERAVVRIIDSRLARGAA